MTTDNSIPENRSSTTAVKSPREGPAFAEPEAAVVDLCGEIIRSVPRDKGEHVTCRRVSGNYYRCNWWQAVSGDGNNAMNGLVVTTHRVSRSRFLCVTRKGNGLNIAMDTPL